MASMGYCRWHNLAHELRACRDYLETRLSEDESSKREEALNSMRRMLEDWGVSQQDNGRLVLEGRSNEDMQDA